MEYDTESMAGEETSQRQQVAQGKWMWYLD